MVEFTPQSLILYSFRLLHLHLVARGITWYLCCKFFEKNFLDFLPRRRFLFVLRLSQPSYVRWSPQGAAKSSPRRFEFVPEKCPDPSGFESRKQSRHYLPFQESGGSNRRSVSISRSFHAVMLLIEFRSHQKLVVDNKLLI